MATGDRPVAVHIEAFTCGKSFARPQDNEDAVVVLPQLGYAVIDGVTDRSGRRFGELRAGRYASGLVARSLTHRLLDARRDPLGLPGGAGALVEHLSGVLRDGYAEHGCLDEAATSIAFRGGCTLALAAAEGRELHLLAVGDSGIRIRLKGGESRLHMESKPLDLVTALLRRETWRLCEELGIDRDERDAIVEQATWAGLSAPPRGLGEAGDRLEARVTEACEAALPGIDRGEIRELVSAGISGQRRFANRDDRDLAYGVMDGFPVPDRHVFTATYPLDEVATIELFSDGYFTQPEDFGIAAWEAGFRQVEREDPDKIGAYPSTKGSGGTNWTDDRTYLGIRL